MSCVCWFDWFEEIAMTVGKWVPKAVSMGMIAILSGCATYDDFTLDTLDGRKVTLSEQRGKAVLLAFWAVG